MKLKTWRSRNPEGSFFAVANIKYVLYGVL
jgi:hypothetical protein